MGGELAVCLDTETTGFNPEDGHRIVEIGCVEVRDGVPTGRTYQIYLNPDRPVPPEATKVHGLTDEFLADKPRFRDVVDGFLEFVRGRKLVIHNAQFDMKFLNAELRALGRPELDNPVEDTVLSARRKFGQLAKVTLDALCKKYEIDNSNRTFHGALLDAELLAEVYLNLIGGRQRGLEFAAHPDETRAAGRAVARKPRPPRPVLEPTAEEAARHAELVGKLKAPVWRM